MGCRSYDEVSRTGFASWSFPRAGAPCHGSHQLVLKFIDLKMLRANCDVLFANSIGKGEAGVMENTHVCSEQSCERTAHSGFLSNPRKTHSLPIFAGMTCFEMLHSPLGCETWGYKEGSHGKTHSVNYGHPLVRSCGHVMVYQGRLLESIMPHSSTNQRH